jgi:hypothetical protein
VRLEGLGSLEKKMLQQNSTTAGTSYNKVLKWQTT